MILNITIVFSNFNPELPKSCIFGLKFKDFHFCTKLCYKFQGADSKYVKIFSRPLPKTPESGIFGPRFKDFHFCTKLCFWKKIGDVYFKFGNTFFKTPAQKNLILSESTSSPACYLSRFLSELYQEKLKNLLKNSRSRTSKMTIVFSNSSLKIHKYDISYEKSKVFSFYVKLCGNLILLNLTSLLNFKYCCCCILYIPQFITNEELFFLKN